MVTLTQLPDYLRGELPNIWDLLAGLRRNWKIMQQRTIEEVINDDDNILNTTTALPVPSGAATTLAARKQAANDALVVSVSRLSILCADMSKRLDSIHLRLHNDAVGEDDESDSKVKPTGRKRDNKSIAVRNEVKKRALEISVAKGLQKEALDDDTPCKRAWAGKAVFDPNAEIERQKLALIKQNRRFEEREERNDQELWTMESLRTNVALAGLYLEKEIEAKADIAKQKAKKRKLAELDSEDENLELTPSKMKKWGQGCAYQ
ncbi:hypothetical protein K505DRAFT_360470 [Melanomma pulvis-pyrius CBS 109.77]|uniref:Uncharacterized protein n=1 Tax=Melanomma pulvis-pyrius CBS 109.77 TaxID=1314802 RepID=A0A6A6XGW9_9PLEO|nr:hypothetical protein K505DRAFT_360470 [Melanomma pulvis-pyrius CBS 109.77]